MLPPLLCISWEKNFSVPSLWGMQEKLKETKLSRERKTRERERERSAGVSLCTE